MKIAVIGGGSMGLAFVQAWLENDILKADSIIVIESSAARRAVIQDQVPLRVEENLESVKDAGVIFIAVKPQDFPAAAKNLSQFLKPEQVVVSIMAGVPVSAISSKLNGHARIARVMPNLPVIIGSGVSAYYVDNSMEHVAVNIIDQLLRAGGVTLRLPSEDLLNAVTAVSGSGPGYIYYFLKAGMEAASEFGFDEEQAKTLIAQTVLGATTLWIKQQRSPQELCDQVTSKGGTTEAALKYMEDKKVGQILKEALIEAHSRAEKLSL